MAESGADGSRLESLRERWERDSSSRLFLQLAEEYRRDGRPAEAQRVLETGLGHHPGYLAARVALGRCRLETGDAAGAAEALERVIAADPTQLVANKLLIATYLRLGRTAEARDRLDLYALLNEADPEIEDLERRLMAAEDAAAPAGPPDLPPAFGEIESLARPSAATPSAPAAPPAAPRPAGPLALTAPLAAAVDLERLPLPATARRRVAASALAPPFPALAAARTRSSGAGLAALAAPGIFRWRAAPSPAGAAALSLVEPSVGEVEEGVGAELALAPEPEAALPQGEVRWWEARPEAEPETTPAAASEPAAAGEPELPEAREMAAVAAPEPPVLEAAVEPGPPAVPEETAVQPWWQLPRAEPPVAIAPLEPALPGEPAADAPAQVEAPTWPAEEVTEPPGVADEPPTAAPGEATYEWTAAGGPMAADRTAPEAAATTTLADLYLEQGHLAEASAAYQEVLALRPGDPAAVAGLARVAARRGLPLGAADLLGGGEVPAGLTARKMQLLQGYLQRIREGAKRHVP